MIQQTSCGSNVEKACRALVQFAWIGCLAVCILPGTASAYDPIVSGCNALAGTHAPSGYDLFACHDMCSLEDPYNVGYFTLVCDIDNGSAYAGGAYLVSDY